MRSVRSGRSRTMSSKLRHAFAVDPEGPAEPTPEQQPVVDWVCRQIAVRHLTTPGLMVLEMARPLNFVAAQAMHFLSPAVLALARPRTHEDYRHLAEFLERRGSTLYLAARIEHFEAEFEREERARAAGGEAGDDAGGGAWAGPEAGDGEGDGGGDGPWRSPFDQGGP